MDARVSAVQKQAAARADVISLAGGLPADELMPREELGRALAYVATRRDEALQYGWPEGTQQLRTWIAQRLALRGAPIDCERVIITAGAQQALSIAAACLHDRPISTGAATYPGALDAFRGAGVEVRAEGGAIRYVTAGVDMPTGVATDHAIGDQTVIVDEAYAELRFDGRVPRPLIADAPERVWHVGTISKTIAPGLRVGWLIPPTAHHAAALERKSAADLHTASICQAALARLLATTDYDAIVARARAAYARRAAILVEALREHAGWLHFREPAGGFSVWAETDEHFDATRESALLDAALAERVMFDPGSLFRPEPGPIAIRISFSNASEELLAEGAKRVGRAFARWGHGSSAARIASRPQR